MLVASPRHEVRCSRGRRGRSPKPRRASHRGPGRCNQHPPEPEVRLTALRRAGGLHSQMTVDEAPFPRKFSEESGECNGLFPTDSHFVRVGLLYKFKKAVPPTLTGILEIHISLRKVNWRSGSRPRRSET